MTLKVERHIDQCNHHRHFHQRADDGREGGSGPDVTTRRVADLMTRTPRTIEPERLAADCIVLMETPPKVTQLVVVDGQRTLVGVVHVHDLFRARVV